MGLGESEASVDSGSAIACSICLEIVAIGPDRSTAILQCGHEFHLDCIGSAFNAKGVMQCPNCRKVEKGNWLYANGSRSLPELGFDELTHDEDLYDLSYLEMTFGAHWCPFSRSARLPSSFEEGEPSPAFALQDLIGYHAMFTGNLAPSLADNASSYLAYFQPLQPSASSNPRVSSESPSDHWNHASATPEVQTHGWEHHHPTPNSRHRSHTSGSNEDAFSSMTVPGMRVDSDGLARSGSFFHPFIFGHGSSSRLAGSFVSSLIPPYITNPRPHAHTRGDRYQHHNPQALHTTLFSGSTNGNLPPPPAPVGPTPPSLPDQRTYYLFPPSAPSSSRAHHQDLETLGGDHFYSWERDQFAPFPLVPVPDYRVGLRHRNGSDRPSAPGRTPHVGRTRPYL
ncbi:uncharacterized protein A4U43_C02F21240 [Asparagus officinalis]|uniref:RING-type domain-containing protein n=1 Tax=Asparagus officinalis TaxID=4686 RepID=A0A5P1FKM1_ASPOF|nr:uncharacterized protein LOC109831823 [Asparagus officinalis]ONK78672.1 uncharacterized protein A4U43_C02F21240 [Asparagus officinalis]